MNRRELAIAIVATLAATRAGVTYAKEPPAEWDGLVRRPSKRFKYVYILPGADFRPYDSVMLDPAQLAFEKDWQKDYNGRTMGQRITDRDIEDAIARATPRATEVFTDAFVTGGYKIATAPGPNVLRITPGVTNIRVSGPDVMRAGRSRTYAGEAGSATLIVEARDSVTDALLGRVADSRVAGDNSIMMMRNSATNRADFTYLAKRWAKGLVEGLNELRRQAPA